MLANREIIHQKRLESLVKEESTVPYLMGAVSAIGIPFIVMQAKTVWDKYKKEERLSDLDVIGRAAARKERNNAALKLAITTVVTGGLLVGLGMRQRKVRNTLDQEMGLSYPQVY
jgi:hypothetical protein